MEKFETCYDKNRERVLYDENTKQVFPYDREKLGGNLKVYEVYTVDELKKIGMPKSDNGEIHALLRLDDGSYRELYYRFCYYFKDLYPPRPTEEWFGKVCLLKNKYRIDVFGLEEQKVLYQVPQDYDFSIHLINKDLAIGHDPDFSAWDVAGAYDASEDALLYKGNVIMTSKNISVDRDKEGHFTGLRIYRGYDNIETITLDQVQELIDVKMTEIEIMKSLHDLEKKGYGDRIPKVLQNCAKRFEKEQSKEQPRDRY